VIDNEDFRDFLVALADAGADFVIVDGYAVAYHGHPRATKDIDVLVRPRADNATRVFRALADFGAPIEALDIQEADFASYDGVLQIGLPPNRIGILTRIDGVSFDEAIRAGHVTTIDARRIPLIGLDALLENKRTSARPQDLADVRALERENTHRSQ